MPFRWSGRAVQNISAAALSALLLTSAMKHFREPQFFAQVVPEYLCREDPDTVPNSSGERDGRHGGGQALAVMSREEWIAVSGLLEAGTAVALLIPATRRVAATAITGMFIVFLAGHVDALRRAFGPAGPPAQRRTHAARLPLQLPLILWAWSLRGAHGGRRP